MSAFNCFKARRGAPVLIRSDNAKTFKKASNTLALKYNIDWIFSTELAPWTGGVWERLVRTIKSCLKVVMKNYNRSNSDFSTCLCLIEEVVNKRPITYCNGNEEDVLPLTPWDFLVFSYTDDIRKPTETNDLSHFFKENNKLVNCFWKRWKLQYLPTLHVNIV